MGIGRPPIPPPTKLELPELLQRAYPELDFDPETSAGRALLYSTMQWMEEQPDMEWVKPQAGVLCFPRIKSEVDIDISKFYNILNKKYGTYVGPGHWFGFDDRYMRIGYGYLSIEDLKAGLVCVTKAIHEAKN